MIPCLRYSGSNPNVSHTLANEKPIAAPLLHPLFRLLEKHLAFSVPRENVFLEAGNGVFQYGQHELLFRLKIKSATKGLKILLRKKRVGLKQRRHPFFHAQSSFVTHKKPPPYRVRPAFWRNKESWILIMPHSKEKRSPKSPCTAIAASLQSSSG